MSNHPPAPNSFDYSRSDRISGLIQRTLCHICSREARDPRLALVNITHVTLSPDLSHARVYITALSSTDQLENGNSLKMARELVDALHQAAPFLRKQLARELRNMRGIPKLGFKIDDEALLQQAGALRIPSEAEAGLE